MKPFKRTFSCAAIIVTLLVSANLVWAGPYVFWVNNDYDRWHDVDCNLIGGNCDHEQDDLGPIEVLKLPSYQRAPDCNYVNAFGQRVIPCTRDLEDFARLWMAGVSSNLIAALPTNSTLTLSWADYEGEPTIDLFAAADGGSAGYLTNAAIATNQIDPVQCPYLGRLGPGQQIQFTKSTWRDSQFIWCGVKYGGGALILTIADGSGNTLAQTKSYIDLVDIKQLYERWTVGESVKMAPMAVPIAAPDGIGIGASPTRFGPPDTPNQPYILFVHGWNMETWEKDRFAEAAFKRLYWQGYQGRFGSFRWPTGNKFSGVISAITDAHNYDNSESNAWASAKGLLNLLTNLNTTYAGNVYLMAHSMGNIVAGEALRRAGAAQVVDTYIAMEGAVPSHAYDPFAPVRLLNATGINLDSGTPNCYSNYWTPGSPCYFNSSAGAATYLNFFNTNDWALSWWKPNQDMKPDSGYNYDGTNFWHSGLLLLFPVDTYEIFALADEARCYAIGAQPNVGGVFLTSRQVDLGVPPFNFSTQHKYHSGQFRSDNMARAIFWNRLLVEMRLK